MAPEAAVSIDQTARQPVWRSKRQANGTTDIRHDAGGMMGASPGALPGGARVSSSTTPGPTQRKASVRYAISGSWWPECLTISDDAGTAWFEVRNSPGFATMLSLSVAGGEEIATIRRRRGGRFQVIVGSKEAGLVRRQWADRYDIHSTLWPLPTSATVPDGRYSITCEGLAQATVSRQIADDVRQTQRISGDLGGGDAAALPATGLALEAVRYEPHGSHFTPRALLED